MTMRNGDSYFAARAVFGAPEWPWRVAGGVFGVVLYGMGIRLFFFFVRRFPLPPQILRVSWLAATCAAVAAAALYAPDRGGAMLQAGLEIGVASLPLMWLADRLAPAGAACIPRRLGWIGGSVIVYIAFAASLGHGLPYGQA
jgi:hypothetical protein